LEGKAATSGALDGLRLDLEESWGWWHFIVHVNSTGGYCSREP